MHTIGNYDSTLLDGMKYGQSLIKEVQLQCRISVDH